MIMKPKRSAFEAEETKTITFTDESGNTLKVAKWLVKNFTADAIEVSVGNELDPSGNWKIPANFYHEIPAGQIVEGYGYTVWEESITIKAAAVGEVEVVPVAWG